MCTDTDSKFYTENNFNNFNFRSKQLLLSNVNCHYADSIVLRSNPTKLMYLYAIYNTNICVYIKDG